MKPYLTLMLGLQMAFGLLPLRSQEIKATPVNCMLGEPIFFRIEMTNTGSSQISCILDPDPIGTITMTLVKGDKGGVTMINRQSGMGGGLQMVKRISPQKSSAWQFFLDSYAIVTKTGTYIFSLQLEASVWNSSTPPTNSSNSLRKLSTTLEVEVTQPTAKQVKADLEALHDEIMASHSFQFQTAKLAILMRYTDPYSTALASDIYLRANRPLRSSMIQMARENPTLAADYLKQFSLETSDARLLSLIQQNQKTLGLPPGTDSQ